MRHHNANLVVRDACSDAFGAGAANAICNPSSTLCCVRYGQAFPACQQFLGKGWCCVGSEGSDNCYVDQESVCDQPDSVSCSELAASTNQACCPRLTTCATNYNASLTAVRCNIQYGDLQQLAKSTPANTSQSRTVSSILLASSSPSLATSTTTASSLSSETTLSTASISTKQLLLPQSSAAPITTKNTGSSTQSADMSSSSGPVAVNSAPASTISTSVLAGMIVGPVIAFILFTTLAYIALRRWSRHRVMSLSSALNTVDILPRDDAQFTRHENRRNDTKYGLQNTSRHAELPTFRTSALPDYNNSHHTYELSSNQMSR